jgi:hypothetical protein
MSRVTSVLAVADGGGARSAISIRSSRPARNSNTTRDSGEIASVIVS